MRPVLIAMCDDEEVMLLAADNLVREVFTAENVEYETESFDSADRLAQACKKRSFDLILLDIEMPGTDGIAFGKALRKYEADRKTGRPADIIYISNHDEMVFDSFMVRPFAFIRKSRIMTEGRKTLKLYIDGRTKADDIVEFRSGTEHYRVSAGDIVYVENILHEQIIHVAGAKDTIKIRNTLSDMEERLSPFGFIKVHTSYLVNWKYIKKMGQSDAILTTGDTVPISKNRKKEVMGKYLRLSKKNDIMNFE